MTERQKLIDKIHLSEARLHAIGNRWDKAEKKEMDLASKYCEMEDWLNELKSRLKKLKNKSQQIK